jgi:hypothetical protein
VSEAPAQPERVPPQRERRVPLRTAFVIALLASLCVHVATMLGSLTFGGAPAFGGEGGVRGAGDVTMDVTIEGPSAPEPDVVPPPPEPAAAAPAPTPETPREEATREETPRERAPNEGIRVPESPVAEPETPTQEAPAEAREAAENQENTASAQTPAVAAGGTEAAQTSGGRAAGESVRRLILGSAGLMPSSVEGQRALLPAATTCEDPIAGVWRALKYSPTFGGQWVRFTLRIKREGDTLTGTIRSRIWRGSPSDRTPPACRVGQTDTTHAMVATGRATGTAITFGASTHRLVADHCPQLFGGVNDYAPDHFSGTIDAMRQEFQSVNNDGAYDVDEPYVFRRIGCLDARRESADEGDSAP